MRARPCDVDSGHKSTSFVSAATVLAHPNVGIDDNFFQVGGHSLLAMQMLARFEEDTGVRLSPRVLILDVLGRVAESLPADRIPNE